MSCIDHVGTAQVAQSAFQILQFPSKTETKQHSIHYDPVGCSKYMMAKA